MAANVDIPDFDFQVYSEIAAKLFVRYRDFYGVLAKRYTDTKKGVGKMIADQLKLSQKALRILLGLQKTGQISKTDLRDLKGLLTSINVNHARIAKLIRIGSKFSEEVAEVSESVEIPFEDLRLAAEFEKKAEKVRRIKKPRPRRDEPRGKDHYGMLGMLGSTAKHLGISERTLIGGGIASQILAPLLGPGFLLPYAGYMAGKVGLGAARGIFRGVKGAIGRLRSRKEPVGGYEGIFGGGEEEGLGGFGGGRGRTPTSVASMMPFTGVTDDPKTWPRDAGGRWTPRGGKEKMAASEGIFYFFDKRARRAKWTREVLRELRAIRKGVGGVLGRGGGIVGDIVAGATGGVVAGAAGGYLAKVLGVAKLAAGGTIAYMLGSLKKWPDWMKIPKGADTRDWLEKFIGIHFTEPYGRKPGETPEEHAERERARLSTTEPLFNVLGSKIKSWFEKELGASVPTISVLDTSPELKIELPGKIPLHPGMPQFRGQEEQTELLREIKENTSKSGEPISTAAPKGEMYGPFDASDTIIARLNILGSSGALGV